MKKTFATILMGPDYDPAQHNARFETKHAVTLVYTVRNFAEAKERILQCAGEGVGVVELCGAFGPDRARELIQLTEGKVGVGYVVHHPDQDGVFSAFFGG